MNRASAGNGDPVVDAFLASRNDRSLLRVVACGSVDDGKSTLIGRLLDETNSGTQGGGHDLLGGLAVQRERGSIPDVAYQCFATPSRAFIVGTPARELYTRNMVAAASAADCALILVDATKGLLTQTRRHMYIVAALGVQHAGVVVTKLDEIEFSESCFREVAEVCVNAGADIGLADLVVLPVSGLTGDNVVSKSDLMPWYEGPTLLEYLETLQLDDGSEDRLPFRFPVQHLNRQDSELCGVAGTIVSGTVARGGRIRVYPSNRETAVDGIVARNGDLDSARAGQAVTLTFADGIEINRGDLIAAADAPPQIADQFEAMVIWMDKEPLLRGRTYLMRIGTRDVAATIAPLKYRVNLDTLEHVAATHLELNEIGVCSIELASPIAFDPYEENRHTGSFTLVDRLSNNTVGAGLLRFALRRSQNLHWQALELDKDARAAAKRQRPCIVWLTGLSGAGKSTIANLVERKLHARGCHTYVLDGDNVRHGLNKDLGFTDADRVENIRRVAEVARLMVDAGLIVVVAFISPFASEREMARRLVNEGEFFEVFVDAPLELAEERDPKGLYRKARTGELANFTGVDSPYEDPERPDLRLDTSLLTAEAAADAVVELLEDSAIVGRCRV